MRKLIMTFAAALALAVGLFATGTAAAKNNGCTTIQSGLLVHGNDNPITLGYDQWGYNYQAHLFNGFADNAARPAVPVTSGDTLIMKWSNSWLSNVNCDGGTDLERGLGTSNLGTSEGWLTNEWNGTYVGADGNLHHYTEFTKIVYAPDYTGPEKIWGVYEIIQDVLNDPYGGYHGPLFKPQRPGFGLNSGWTS